MPTRAETVKTSLRGLTTESAANTFTESTIDTNLAIRGDHIFVITGIWFNGVANLTAATDALEIQVTYATQSDIIEINDPDWLLGAKWLMTLTTSGGSVYQPMLYYQIDHFPIAVAQLHLGVKGTSLAAAGSGGVKIEGYHQKVSTTEYFRLAQSR